MIANIWVLTFCWKPHHTADPYQAWSHTSAPLSLSLLDCLPQAIKELSVLKPQRIPSNRHCPGWPLLTEVHGGSTVQRHKLKVPRPRFSIEARPAAPEGSCASLKGNKCPEISISSSARTKFARLRVKGLRTPCSCSEFCSLVRFKQRSQRRRAHFPNPSHLFGALSASLEDRGIKP